MEIKQFDLWLADLNPQRGTEPGKTRPVVIVQTNLLNALPHPSSLICPISTNTIPEAKLLRISLKKGTGQLEKDCDILIDQIRAIDNQRLLKPLGTVPEFLWSQLRNSLRIVLDV